jgi:hypothetical protein
MNLGFGNRRSRKRPQLQPDFHERLLPDRDEDGLAYEHSIFLLEPPEFSLAIPQKHWELRIVFDSIVLVRLVDQHIRKLPVMPVYVH